MIVVDASVVASALIDDGADGDLARARLLDAQDLHAPHLIDLEVLAVLRRLSNRLEERRLELARIDFNDLSLTRYPHVPFADRIWELHGSLTTYDAAYIALAEVLECSFLTADRRLAKGTDLRCEVEVLAAS